MNVLTFEKQVQIISALTEGCSIRSTERLTGANRNTMMSLGVRVGDGCERLHDRLMRDLNVGIIECDEQWDFIAKKQKRVRQGDPSEFGDVPENISTSYVERFNLSSRMQMRRCTRLTNGFSKKLENHRAAISLWIAFYNFCRVHETLRCTPAMALGVTDHIWTIAELVAAALEPSDVPPLPRPTPTNTLKPGYRPFRPIVIRGGRGPLCVRGCRAQ
jgi:hypothetical protein